MRNFTVLLFLILSSLAVFAQSKNNAKGTILNDKSFLPVDDVNVINITQVKGTISKRDGSFSIEANLNDSIHFSYPGYIPIKLKVTNDWLNNDNLKIYLTEQTIVLDEIVIKKFDLTGYLEVDTKLIELNDKMKFDFYRRNQTPYYGTAMGTFFSPVDVVYNLFKGKDKKLKKLEAIKEDQNMIALMQTRYDREIVCGLLEITREDIVKSLQNCNYSDKFIYTATDFQIYQALNDCYDSSKVLATKKKNTSN
ncbi:carboxypeptidase-like regulatory domain-containing protein [Myroides sp. M-43]|uniref:carboxypeptidase-like regulatory domain-containing protein n=1 Tax=Myroides oncorhynchi TaxID=2893756 RepID=UPI001E2C805F|nr:carboxypeptidase-like regulatory domain-containing protein [Myroides oncorhynchi]MCC9044203.1 carboxypeptidase-like regulatory domain-containing protein [Myroides oncorhynchi]